MKKQELTLTVLRGLAKELNISGVSKAKKEVVEANIRRVLEVRLFDALEKGCFIPTLRAEVDGDILEVVDGNIYMTKWDRTGAPTKCIDMRDIKTGEIFICPAKDVREGLCIDKKEEEVEMNKNVTMVEDNIGANAKVVLDDIPTPINADKAINEGNPLTFTDAIREALKHPAGTIIEVGTEEEIKAVADAKKDEPVAEVVEPVKTDVDMSRFIPGIYVLNLKTVVPYVLAKIEDNGLYKLLNSNNRPTWLRPSYIVREDLYKIISQEEARKMINNKGAVQSSAAKTVKTNNTTLSKEQIIAKAKVAGEYAKTNFKYRVEQANNFRQMFLIDNETGKKLQVGVGATIAGRVMEYEYEGTKITIDRTGANNKVAEDKSKYINTKRTKTLCVECQKAGKKHFITESEAKYLMDNQKFIADEYKGKGLCYKHQATTGVKRAIIAGRRNDVTVGNTSLLK